MVRIRLNVRGQNHKNSKLFSGFCERGIGQRWAEAKMLKCEVIFSRTLSNEEPAVRQLLGRFVALEVRDKILSGRISLDGDGRRVTLLFADIIDFRPLVEITPHRRR